MSKHELAPSSPHIQWRWQNEASSSFCSRFKALFLVARFVALFFTLRPSSFVSGLSFLGVERREFANISKETRCPRAQISEAKCGRGRVFTCLPSKVTKKVAGPLKEGDARGRIGSHVERVLLVHRRRIDISMMRRQFPARYFHRHHNIGYDTIRNAVSSAIRPRAGSQGLDRTCTHHA